MTALDGNLAWAISEWAADLPQPISRGEIELLTSHLQALGYALPESDQPSPLIQAARTVQFVQRSLNDLLKETRAPEADPAAKPTYRQAQPHT